MDVKVIIKDMMKKGKSREEIIANLEELGVDNPEELYDKSTETMKEMELPKAEGRKVLKEATRPLFGGEKEKEEDEMPHPLFESIGRGEKKEEEKEEEARELVEEVPKLEITSIEGDDENTVDIESMLGKADKREAMEKMPSTSFADTTAVEKKLDDAIALLKALQELDRQILTANREMLNRLRKGS